jgi:NAD-dependent SIR2 family protein deacetylase
MFTRFICSKCYNRFEHYQKRQEVPPCPCCGYPELKTSEEYYKAMGINLKKVVIK